MPPRPPPPPSTLTLLCSAAALVAVWLSTAVDQLARGLLGVALGVSLRGIVIGTASLPHAIQAEAHLGPGAYTVMVLGGPLAILGAAGFLQVVTSALRAPGWLRGFALVWLVVALLWLPAAFAAGAVSGKGPVAELYDRLGAPLAGRWTAFALGAMLLLLLSRVASRQAVSVGRAWMRADAVEFRRRLVRVTAGWPGVVAVGALAWWAGWAPTPWVVIFLTMVLMSLQISTL